jgi:hypothetical protein
VKQGKKGRAIGKERKGYIKKKGKITTVTSKCNYIDHIWAFLSGYCVSILVSKIKRSYKC